MKCIALLFLVLTSFTLTLANKPKKLPSSFKTCPRDEPNVNECVRSAVEDVIRNTLAHGLPSFGILPLDPLEITSLNLYKGQGSVSVDLHYKNLKVYGIKDVTLHNLRHDVEDYTMTVEAKIPHLHLEADYEMDGRALLIPIKGRGKCNISISDTTNNVKLIMEPFYKNGIKYVKDVLFEYKISAKKMQTQFDNLFNGDETLGKSINKFLNENWEVVFKELKPAMEEAFGQIFINIANKIYTVVPYDEIFPPSSKTDEITS